MNSAVRYGVTSAESFGQTAGNSGLSAPPVPSRRQHVSQVVLLLLVSILEAVIVLESSRCRIVFYLLI